MACLVWDGADLSVNNRETVGFWDLPEKPGPLTLNSLDLKPKPQTRTWNPNDLAF